MREINHSGPVDLQELADSPERLAAWAKDHADAFLKLLIEVGLSAEDAAELLERGNPSIRPRSSDSRATPRRPKFSQLKEAVPSPMTDAEYANVLAGRTRER